MKIKKTINIIFIVLCITLAAGIGAFIYNANNGYDINNNFVSLPLQFNPDDSSSTYQMKDVKITVHGGFVKGLQKGNGSTESLVLRALSPLPSITVEGKNPVSVSLILENVNPDYYAKLIAENNLSMSKVAANTLQFNVEISAGETIEVEPLQPETADNTGGNKYVILGDNRDGYDTFGEIIQQVNGESPIFVIDNGDLVFSGKPNQYRLFDQMTSKISTTLCTTLGNHDMRGNGRETYTKLYGPAYYSFDFTDSHFVFVDSSPGWTEKQAISDEQYLWLERDLKKAQGKKIFVITHIPPKDPRSGVTKNEIPNYVNRVKNGESWIEKRLDNYNYNKIMAHGFQDPEETLKFENLMSTYHVDTVYLSHIHSYMEYTKDNVRYLISGGAGAELLFENSYFHYMIAKIGDIKTTTMVELPSPANNYVTRYLATIQLFASAMYKENRVAVIFIVAGFALFISLVIIKIYLWRKNSFDTFSGWIRDSGKYSGKRFKQLFGRSKDK